MHMLPGHIQSFYVNHNGRRLGPYFARVWKQNGKRRKQYVPANKLAEVAAACQNYKERRKRQIEKRKELDRILGNLIFLQRVSRQAKRIEHLFPHEQEHVRRIQTEGVAAPGRPSARMRRRFMGPLIYFRVQKHPRPLPECMAKRLREAAPPPTPEPAPPIEPPTPKPFRRYWTLPHDLPEWFTEELWQEMAARIPKDKPKA